MFDVISVFKIKCLLLDELYDDYSTIWELINIIDEYKTSNQSFYSDVSEVLNSMKNDGLLECFIGTAYAGEEKLIDDFVFSETFINQHINDLNTKKYLDEDIRFSITEIGKHYYFENCKIDKF